MFTTFPLLDEAEHKNGILYMSGNLAIININLSRVFPPVTLYVL